MKAEKINHDKYSYRGVTIHRTHGGWFFSYEVNSIGATVVMTCGTVYGKTIKYLIEKIDAQLDRQAEDRSVRVRTGSILTTIRRKANAK